MKQYLQRHFTFAWGPGRLHPSLTQSAFVAPSSETSDQSHSVPQGLTHPQGSDGEVTSFRPYEVISISNPLVGGGGYFGEQSAGAVSKSQEHFPGESSVRGREEGWVLWVQAGILIV